MEDVNGNGEGITNLQDCLISSSTGNHEKISIKSEFSDDETTECLIKVSPVVARRPETSEVMAVEHFCVELYLADDDASSSIRSASPASSAQALAVGVMG